MVTIDPSESICTLINTFTVSPENHEELFEMLQGVTEGILSCSQGYISSSLHLSDDTRTITNYAQWRSLDDFNMIMKEEEVQKRMREIMKLAEKYDHKIYHIIWQNEHQNLPASYEA